MVAAWGTPAWSQTAQHGASVRERMADLGVSRDELLACGRNGGGGARALDGTAIRPNLRATAVTTLVGSGSKGMIATPATPFSATSRPIIRPRTGWPCRAHAEATRPDRRSRPNVRAPSAKGGTRGGRLRSI